MKDKIKVNVIITKKQYELLKKEKREIGSSFGSIIRQAIMEYFSKRKVAHE